MHSLWDFADTHMETKNCVHSTLAVHKSEAKYERAEI